MAQIVFCDPEMTRHVSDQSVPKSPFRKSRKVMAAVAVVVAVVVGALVFSNSLLCVDSGPPQPADAIIVLGGGVFDRPPKAAELFQAGFAKRIIVTGDGDCDENRLALVARGVPQSAIEVECRSRTTWENARFTEPLLKAAGARKVIIVTSWYHSRRALNTFRTAVPTIEFTSAPSHHSDRQRLRTTVGRIYKEYAKIAWYWARWGVPP
jgi:uncharacterized SAM-binding protein YcdF (DUF218 family)